MQKFPDEASSSAASGAKTKQTTTEKSMEKKKKYDLYPEKVYQYFYIMCPRTVMSDS